MVKAPPPLPISASFDILPRSIEMDERYLLHDMDLITNPFAKRLAHDIFEPIKRVRVAAVIGAGIPDLVLTNNTLSHPL